MAIIRNLWLKGAHKRIGGAVLYYNQGRTIARELAPSVKNPRTIAQMAQRVKWANLVNFYRVNSSWMKKAFENKKRNQTDYNRFMQLNASMSTIYLTKQEAEQGVTIPMSYTMSEGSLPTLPLITGEGSYSLDYDDKSISSENVTLKDLSNFLINSPWSFNNGDQLSIIYVTLMDDVNNKYYCDVKKEEIIIDENSLMPMSDIIKYSAVHLNNGVLNFAPYIENASMCLIHTVDNSGRIYVSTQNLQINSVINDIIDEFSSSQQFKMAISSYGENDNYFLDPKDNGSRTGLFEGIKFDWLETSEGDVVHTGGFIELENFTDFTIHFNKTLPLNASKVVIIYEGSNQGINTNVDLTKDNYVSASISKIPTGSEKALVKQISILFDKVWMYIRLSDQQLQNKNKQDSQQSDQNVVQNQNENPAEKLEKKPKKTTKSEQ